MRAGKPLGINDEIMTILNEFFPQIGRYPDKNRDGNMEIGGRVTDIDEFVKLVKILKMVKSIKINKYGTRAKVKIVDREALICTNIPISGPLLNT